MTPIKTLASTLAITALLTGGAIAQSVNADVNAGAGANVSAGQTGAGATADIAVTGAAGTGSATGATGATIDGVKIKKGGALGADVIAEADGRAVVSADGITLGVVESVDMTTEGNERLIVNLGSELGLDIDRVSIATSAVADAEAGAPTLKIGMSEAEFRSAVQAGIDARTN